MPYHFIFQKLIIDRYKIVKVISFVLTINFFEFKCKFDLTKVKYCMIEKK